MQDRAFVLMPLMDVAPGFVFGGRSVESWLEDADRAGIEVADSRSDWWR
jgi:2-amino-4-hydroxy-6-hydroxymethyldihydropteridine diphosphokinase